jgi:DnaJ-class molecular chaperone
MEELKQAYEILKDPKKRELYKKQAEQQGTGFLM